jgi:hypothetical protein
LAKSKLHNEDTIAYKILRATTTQDYIQEKFKRKQQQQSKIPLKAQQRFFIYLMSFTPLPPQTHTLS